MKGWKQFRTEMQNSETPVITEQDEVTESQEESLFWQQLESLSQRLQNGMQQQLNQNCLDTAEPKTDKERWEHLLEGMILLSAIHLFGIVESRGGIRQVLTPLIPESNL